MTTTVVIFYTKEDGYTLLNNDYLSVSFAVEKYHQHILFIYSSHFEIAHLFQYDVEK